MKLYKIRDWNLHYENNRSRVIENCRWVPIPNRHDGETFSLIMSHEDGPVIFAGWILLVQLASKCTPRGTLVKGNGEPHNVTSMSAKCRMNVTHLQKALLYLESNTDWIEVVEVTNETSGERQVSAVNTSTKEGRKEGIEGRETVADAPVSKFKKPTQAELEFHADAIGLPRQQAESFFSYYESNGWKVAKNPMKCWKSAMTGWRNRWQERSGGFSPAAPANGDSAPSIAIWQGTYFANGPGPQRHEFPSESLFHEAVETFNQWKDRQ